MISLAEVPPTLIDGTRGQYLPVLLERAADWNHRNPPASWLENTPQFGQRFAIIFNVLQDVRTNKSVKARIRIAIHRGDVHSVINVLLEEIGGSISNSVLAPNVAGKRGGRSNVQEAEIRLLGLGGWQAGRKIDGIEPIAVRGAAVGALVSPKIARLKVCQLKVRSVLL